jgi:hypothetical protein
LELTMPDDEFFFVHKDSMSPRRWQAQRRLNDLQEERFRRLEELGVFDLAESIRDTLRRECDRRHADNPRLAFEACCAIVAFLNGFTNEARSIATVADDDPREN